MADTGDCKKIEKCIKDMIFKNVPCGNPIAPPQEIKPNLNHTPFSIDDRCLVSNIEKVAHLPQNSMKSPFGGISSTGITNQAGASELIDLNVLTNFAAQHIEDPAFSPSNLALNSKDVKLPHPDLDDCSLGVKNGEQDKGISVLLNSISKEIQNSPNFLSMPENPLPQISGSPKRLDLFNNPHLAYSQNNSGVPPYLKQKEQMSTDKNLKKKKKGQKKNKEKKVKEKNPDSNISKDSPFSIIDTNKKSESLKENSIIKNKSPITTIKKKDIKSIEKQASEESSSEQRPDIKLKKSVFASIGKEYSFYRNEGGHKFQCHICNWNNDSKDAMANHLSSKNHRLSKNQNDLDMMLPFLPEPLKPQVEAITDILVKIASANGLQKADLQVRDNLSVKVKQFVKDHEPSCSVDLVGSSSFSCGLKTSEVDFVLNVGANGDIPDSLENLYEFLKKDSAYDNVVNDFKKKRPCIKFVDHETKLPCNILIDNGSSLKIANLLSLYFQLDDRAQVLGIALRFWAKLCHIDQQDSGTLPSFCYALLVVHFLQQVQPPVLPVLHELKNYASTTEFYSEYITENKWKSQNTDSIGTLWLKLFQYYNFDYKIGENVVCIQSSKRVTCKERNWSTKFYAVEDPFMKRNIAYVIPTYQVCHFIQQCFVRTYRYFAYPQLKNGTIKLLKTDSFDALKLSEYVPNTTILKEEGSDDSEESENEDSDILNASQDLEDHDPDISVEDFVSTVSNLSLTESNTEDTMEKPTKSAESPISDSAVLLSEDNSLAKKQGDKSKETQSKNANKITQPICYWDVSKREFVKEDFRYEFLSSTFKGDKNVPLTCKLCKSSGHQKKDCPSDDLPPVRPLPKMTSEFLEVITKVLSSIRDKNAVSKKEISSIENHMRDVQNCIRQAFPDATLKLFGSFCNGFGFKNNSDMDFCLTFGDHDGKGLDSTDIIKKLDKQLRHHPELENITSITTAKVPIVKFSWRKTGIEGDISLYNTLALVNTEMLEAYSKIDTRVQILGYALKHFAKHLGICDASRGSLSSYAYILMVIYFLQQRNPPVIPVLQELYNENEEKPCIKIEECNVWFFRDINKLKDVWPDYGKNKESVGELWLGLLNFYTVDFDWKEYVISIKQKKLLSRFKKLWNTNQLAIEDPFDLNHNLGAGLSKKMNTYILETFIRGRERFGCPRSLDKTEPEAYLFNRIVLNSGREPPQDRGCSNCGKIGHIARNCSQEKTCSLCRKPGHLVKNCPRRRDTKKSRDRDHKRSQNAPNSDRKDSNERRNLPISNQKFKNEYMRPFGGIPQQAPMPDMMQGKKLAMSGIPAHRMPPPGFQARGIIANPPPGFKPNIPLAPGMANYPPPFSGMEPSIIPPFPRGANKNDMHAQSPPKQYSSSPPKNFPSNKPALHQPLDSWTMNRPGFHAERPRNMQMHMVPQGRRHLNPHQVERHMNPQQVERHLNPQQLRSNPWPPERKPRFAAPNRTNSDNIPFNSNHSERW